MRHRRSSSLLRLGALEKQLFAKLIVVLVVFDDLHLLGCERDVRGGRAAGEKQK